MDNLKHKIQVKFKTASIVEKLIYINVAVFILTYVVNTISYLFSAEGNFVFEWFSLEANVENFIFKPWTLITYGFLHGGLMHIFLNLLVLYYIGNLFIEYFTQKQLLNFYILGTVFGGLVFMLSYNFFPALDPTHSRLVGASAGVTAIFSGIATYIPNYALRLRFIGFVKLWVLVAIWIGLDIVQIPMGNAGGHIAHLGGALLGFLYVRQSQSSTLASWLSEVFKKKKKPLRTVYKSTKKRKSKPTKNTVSNQQRVNEILDKISKSGYDTLTKEEKEFLFKQGKK